MFDLKMQVRDSLRKTMETTVSQHTIKKVNNSIRVDVYGAYSPQIYQRKYALYGKKNHNVEVSYDGDGDSVVMKYYHRAYMGGKDLSKLIILGQDGARAYGSGVALYNEKFITAYKSSGANDRNPFYKPRDFIQGAKDNISKGDIVKMLKSGIG